MTSAPSPSAHDQDWVCGLLGIEPTSPAAPRHEFTEVDRLSRGVRIRSLVLHSPGHEAIPALYLTPADGEGPWPGAIAIHQHNYEYHLGKSEPAGLAGDPSLAYGRELALRGTAVIVPDMNGFEERRGPFSDDREFELFTSFALVAEGSSRAAQLVADLRRVLSWLESQPEILPSFGAIGHSLGGQLAFFTAAADARLSAMVSNCGVGSLASFAEAGRLHNPGWYIPRLAVEGDAQALAATYGDRRAWISSGTEDPWFPVQGVRDVAAAFPAGGAQLEIFEGEHGFPAELRGRAIDWLALRLTEGKN